MMGSLIGTVKKQVLVADGCERHHHIGEKQRKRRARKWSLAGLLAAFGFVKESLLFLVTIWATLPFRWVPVASLRIIPSGRAFGVTQDNSPWG